MDVVSEVSTIIGRGVVGLVLFAAGAGAAGVWAQTHELNSANLDGIGPCAGMAAVFFDDRFYGLVEIGTQCWFKENRASDSYRNGDSIPGNCADAEWSSMLGGAQAIYGEAWAQGFDVEASLKTYGRLYNFFAVRDSRGLCPEGYHVPSDEEWTVLENHLGGSNVAGTALKSSPSDTPAWDGDNSSGFSALPGGLRNFNDGHFDYQGDNGFW